MSAKIFNIVRQHLVRAVAQKRLHRFAFAFSLASATAFTPFTTTAIASDFLDDDASGVETEVEFGTGWYLRGDIGSTIRDVTTDVSGVSFIPNSNTDLGMATSFGIGAGYNLGGFRLEVSAHHYTGLSYGGETAPYDCGSYETQQEILVDVPVLTTDAFGDPVVINVPTLQETTVIINDNGSCTTKSEAEIQASTLMAEAYLDGPSFGGITPYVGAGAGIAAVSWNSFGTFDLCRGSSITDCTGQGHGVHTLDEGTVETQTDFVPAFSIMLGGAYNISRNMKLDLGYRYTQISNHSIATVADNRYFSTSNLEADDIDIHEVRLGLRYEIW